MAYSVYLGANFFLVAFNFIFFYFLLPSGIVAFLAKEVADGYMIRPEFPEDKISYIYAFDVHCNGFFPLFMLQHVLHYLLLPFLI